MFKSKKKTGLETEVMVFNMADAWRGTERVQNPIFTLVKTKILISKNRQKLCQPTSPAID